MHPVTPVPCGFGVGVFPVAHDGIGGGERAGREGANANLQKCKREGLFLPGSLQDSLHPGMAFSRAFPSYQAMVRQTSLSPVLLFH